MGMHQIGVVGVSYRHAGVDAVARFALARPELATRLAALRARLAAAEILYVATCNRVEVIYTTADDSAAGDARHDVFQVLTGHAPQAGEATRILRAWTGEAAVEHLLLLACGLDSAQTGEQEIAAQLRAAWEEGRAAHSCGPVLDRLMGEALGMARRVRGLTAADRPPSLGDLAAQRVRAHLDGTAGRVALVGVSPMTRRCAALLHKAQVPLLVVNRTPARAAQLAREVSGEVISLPDFRAAPPECAAVVLAAGGGDTLLDEAALARLRAAASTAPLLIDFGVPPNIDRAAAQRAGLARVGMDDLIEAAQGRRLGELMRLAPVRAAIDERLAQLRAELATRSFGPQLAELRGAFEQIAAEEVARALSAGLRTLDDGQRGQLERLARTVAHRLAHLPLAGIRAAAVHAGPDALEVFFEAARASRTRADTEKT
ncbi:MAG: glutamyl-tRNA reductase [Steroidobacteraceae bacterium]